MKRNLRRTRRAMLGAGAFAFAVLACGPGAAQAYPERPLTFSPA